MDSMNSSLDESGTYYQVSANGLPLKKILKSRKRIFDE